MADETTLSISETITTVTVAEDITTINIAPIVTTVEAKGLAISVVNASALPVTPYGTVTATNVQDALQQLADQNLEEHQHLQMAQQIYQKVTFSMTLMMTR